MFHLILLNLLDNQELLLLYCFLHTLHHSVHLLLCLFHQSISHLAILISMHCLFCFLMIFLSALLFYILNYKHLLLLALDLLTLHSTTLVMFLEHLMSLNHHCLIQIHLILIDLLSQGLLILLNIVVCLHNQNLYRNHHPSRGRLLNVYSLLFRQTIHKNHLRCSLPVHNLLLFLFLLHQMLIHLSHCLMNMLSRDILFLHILIYHCYHLDYFHHNYHQDLLLMLFHQVR